MATGLEQFIPMYAPKTLQEILGQQAKVEQAQAGQRPSAGMQMYNKIVEQLGPEAGKKYLERQEKGTSLINEEVLGALKLNDAIKAADQSKDWHPMVPQEMATASRAVDYGDGKTYRQSPYDKIIYDVDPDQEKPAQFMPLPEQEKNRILRQKNQLDVAKDYINQFKETAPDLYTGTGELGREARAFAERWGFKVKNKEDLRKAAFIKAQQMLTGEDLTAALSSSRANETVQRNLDLIEQKGASKSQVIGAYDSIVNALNRSEARNTFRSMGIGRVPYNEQARQREDQFVKDFMKEAEGSKSVNKDVRQSSGKTYTKDQFNAWARNYIGKRDKNGQPYTEARLRQILKDQGYKVDG